MTINTQKPASGLALLIAATVAAAGASAGAVAQESAGAVPDASLAEVVVTARKREEKLLDVPISIQAFSEQQARESGIRDLQTLKDFAGFQLPSVLSTSPAGRFYGVVIFRGLQASAFGAARDSSGSLFVDGIFVSGGQQSINTADVERIEVLKGPQNTYFGRSTFGGAVNFITRNPSEDFGGTVNLTTTARGTIDGDVSVEGALVPGKLTGRLTAFTHNKVDQYVAGDGGGMGGEKSQGLTGTLYFTPSDKAWVRLRGQYQQDDDNAGDTALLSANTYAAGACTGKVFPGFNGRTGVQGITLARNYFCNGIPSLATVLGDTITTSTAVPLGLRDALRANPLNVPFFGDVPNLTHSGLRRNALRASAQAGYTFANDWSVGLNVGYNNQQSVSIYDIDRTNALAFLSAQAFRSEDLTADLRFLTDPSKPVRLLVGVSNYSSKYEVAQYDWQYLSSTATRSTNFTNERAHVPAVYASIDWDILKNLTFTAEARYQKDKPISYNPAGQKFEAEFKDTLPRFSLKYSPIDDLNLYASYSKGVQPAGFNGTYPNLNAAQQAFVQSVYPGIGIYSLVPKVSAYEVGAKQRLFDGRVDYTVAIYQMDWDNAVSTSALFNPAACFNTTPATQFTAACPLGIGGTSIQTPNDARIKGVEFAITGRITPQWTVQFTGDYKDAKWKKYANTGFNATAGLTAPGDVYRADGNHLGRVPDFQGTLSSTFRGATFSNGMNWYVRGDALYTGKAWDSDLNVIQTKDYVRVNAHVGLEKDSFLIELFSTNLFNDKTWDYAGITVELSGNFTQRALLVQPAQKREVGLRMSYKF
jgi:iron complex outermembrane receptor protein